MVGYKTRFIVNPSADKGRAGRLAEEFRPILDSFGEVEFCATTHPTHGSELASQAGEAGCSLVIAAGGDGTIHEVVNGLMQVPLEARPRLGIVPLGSGNDFAPMIGITGKPEETLQKVFTGEPRRIDVGKYVLGDGKPEYFNNTFGLGFDATVTIRTLQLIKLRGYLMYLVAVLQTIALNLDATMMHIKTESASWDEETIMLVVCNGPREGGGFLVAPAADATDGKLNYASVCRISRMMMLRLIPEVMNGTHGRFKQVRLGELQRIDIRAEKPVTIHADGEVICGFGSDVTHVTVEIIPGAVELML